MEYILDYVCIGDVLGLVKTIERRKRREALLTLAITHNPFSKEPETLVRELEEKGSYTNDSKMDRESMNRLKESLKKSKVIKVKT